MTLGQPEDIALLGAVTLEELGLEVDPRTQTLRPSETYMLAVA